MLRFLGLSEHRLRHSATRMGAGLVLALASSWPLQASAQHTSALCPAQTATVTAGGPPGLQPQRRHWHGWTCVFEFSDGAMSGIGDIHFTIHINPSASLITMTPRTLPAFTFRGTSSCS